MGSMGAGHPAEWAVASFRDAMAQEPVEIVFEAWKSPQGEPFRCFVFPVSTKEQDAIWKARAKGGIEALVEVIMQRAKDREGNRIFQLGHGATLRNETLSDELSDLAYRINAAAPQPAPDLGAAAKR